MIKIARTVFDEKDITLQDGKEVTLRPLPIALLKKAMKAWGKIGEAEEEDAIFDVYVQCAGISLSREFKGDGEGEFPKPIANDGTLAKDYREHLEEILDTPTIFEVLEVCMGLRLNDPKLAEAVEEAMMEQDGTT